MRHKTSTHVNKYADALQSDTTRHVRQRPSQHPQPSTPLPIPTPLAHYSLLDYLPEDDTDPNVP
jgi:hypothetical protein